MQLSPWTSRTWRLCSPQDSVFPSSLNTLRQRPATPAQATVGSGACRTGEPRAGGSLPNRACVLPSAPRPALPGVQSQDPCDLGFLLGSERVIKLTTIFQWLHMHELLLGFCYLFCFSKSCSLNGEAAKSLTTQSVGSTAYRAVIHVSVVPYFFRQQIVKTI